MLLEEPPTIELGGPLLRRPQRPIMTPELRSFLDRLPEVDTSLADTFPGRGAFSTVPVRHFVLHWWTVPTGWDFDALTVDDDAARAKLAATARMQAGYHGVEWGGVPYQTAPLDAKQWHAGGSAGMKDANSLSVGFAVATMGPSYRPRGIPGEVQRPWFDRQGDKTWKRLWYPPIPTLDSLLAAVAFARHWQREQGRTFSGVFCHHHINNQKNDLRNMDAHLGHNTALSFAQFKALVQA